MSLSHCLNSWLTLSLVGIVLWLLYKLCVEPYKYWERKGVPCIKGSFPFGSKNTLSFFKKYQGYLIDDYYKELGGHAYGGYYMYRSPVLLLKDPEVIKKIMTKDFTHFRSRFGQVYHKQEPLSLHLFNVENDFWKSVRVRLTPTFTTGRLKMMFNLFELCANELLDVLIEEQKGKGEIDIKDTIARFTTDIIATCAFGLEVNSLKNPDSEFREIGHLIFPTNIPIHRKCRVILFGLFPSLVKKHIVRMAPKKVETFLMKVIADTVEYRDRKNIRRGDFLNLLMDLRQACDDTTEEQLERPSKSPNYSRHDVKPIKMDIKTIAAQCFVFFAAGFETSSSVQSYALYELSCHMDIQERLRKEINKVLAKYDGQPTYQALQEMPYLDQVINETIRKYPTLPLLTRVCTENYRLPDSDLEIEKGTHVHIPVYSLHHDTKYYTDPDKFDPERFSVENINSIGHCTFMPFGEGPRFCIGNRFGLLQTKLGIITVIKNMRVIISEKSNKPLQFVPTNLVSSVRDPIWIKLEKIN